MDYLTNEVCGLILEERKEEKALNKYEKLIIID